MKALVTGAAGFIGSHVTDHALALGMDVVAVDDLSGGYRDNVAPAARFIQGTVTDSAFIDELCRRERFDYIYHLAAYAAEGLSHFIRRFNYETNLVGSMNLIDAAVNTGVKGFVFTSSIAVYGAGQTPMTEEMTPRPEDPYGISKYAVELDLEAAHRQFGLNYVVFRPHNVYGERQNIGDKYRNVIGIFMNQIMQGKPLTIFGDGTQTRAFSYIDDVAPVIARSALTPKAFGQVFNIGGNTATSVNELARTVQQAFGAAAPIRHLQARQEVLHAFSSHDKIARYFDLKPETTLADGIQRMADWAKKHGPRKTAPFADIEIPRGLPEGW